MCHKLEDILIIGLCTIICKGDDFTDMEDFGCERKEWLETFLELPNGIPNSDTFRRVFEKIRPEKLSKALYSWLDVERSKRAVVAIDGKTIGGSKSAEHRAYYVVSAWVVESQITLGEIAVDEKSNEITAVPELLDMLEVEGCIITADAMSCQKDIAQKIVEKKADYVLGLKGNQSSLHDDVKLYLDHMEVNQKTVTKEKGHGRIEVQEYFFETDIDWLPQKPLWSGFAAIGAAKSTVFEKEETRKETRYFISSLSNASEFAYAVRKHWSIENQLHWCLYVFFREDDASACKDLSLLNMNVLRKTALSLLKHMNWGRIGLKKNVHCRN